MKRLVSLLGLLVLTGCYDFRYRHSVLEYTPLPAAHSRGYWEARIRQVPEGAPLAEVVCWLPGVLYAELPDEVTVAVLDQRWQVAYRHHEGILIGRPELAKRQPPPLVK